MANVKKVCDLCGAKLKKISGMVSVCPVCGTYVGGIDPNVLKMKQGQSLSPVEGKLYIKAGRQIIFGRYPQTIATDEAVAAINKTPLANGHYFCERDKAEYVRMNADPFSPFVKYSNGKIISRGALSYFKIEPIHWRILHIEDGYAFLVAENIIECGPFQTDLTDKFIGGRTVYANNWEHSQVRKWLNTTFINSAFNADERSIIDERTVRMTDTGFYEDDYAKCQNDTTDKLYLLAYKEIFRLRYGVGHYESRSKKLSDYTKAKGVQPYFDGTVYGSGLWWLRSSGCQSHYVAFVDSHGIVDINGYLIGCGVSMSETSVGIVPCMWIKL